MLWTIGGDGEEMVDQAVGVTTESNQRVETSSSPDAQE